MRRVLVASVLLVVYIAGCDREDPASATRAGSAATAPAIAPAKTPLFTLPVDVPFTGTIKARHLKGPLPVGEITYTIGRSKIRREYLDRSDVVTEHLARTPPISGVVVDLDRRRVTLYATYLERRHSLEMPIEDYDERLRTGSGLAAVRRGMTFLPLIGADYSATNEPDADTVSGVRCDVLRIDPPPATVSVRHCRAIVVDRQLLQRSEPGIPAGVTGFPLRVEVGEAIPAGVEDIGSWLPGPSDGEGGTRLRVGEVAGRAVRATTRAATRAAQVLDLTTEVTHVATALPAPDACEVPAGFVRCETVEEFDSATNPGGDGGGFDFD